MTVSAYMYLVPSLAQQQSTAHAQRARLYIVDYVRHPRSQSLGTIDMYMGDSLLTQSHVAVLYSYSDPTLTLTLTARLGLIWLSTSGSYSVMSSYKG